jgi:hypothetical protein
MIHDFRHPEYTLPDADEQKANDDQRKAGQAEAGRLSIKSTASAVADPDISSLMQQDSDLQDLMRDPAYLSVTDSRHKSIVAKVQARIEKYGNLKVEDSHLEGYSSGEVLQNVDANIPELRKSLCDVEIQGKRLTASTIDALVEKSARDLPLGLTKNQAEEILKFVEAHPQRFSTKITDKKITSALSVLSLKLRETITA